jgi:DNA-binding beta-propeller fold protein YncE
MPFLHRLALVALAAAGAAAQAPAQPAARVLPGLQPDGSTLLHDQWSLRPVGRQLELGDYPVNLAVDPSGRYAAVLHVSRRDPQIRIVDLRTERVSDPVPVHQAFYGLAFSPDGTQLWCSGGTDDVIRGFGFSDGRLAPRGTVRLAAPELHSAVSGVAVASDNRTAYVGLLFVSRVAAVDLETGATLWTASLDPPGATPPAIRDDGAPVEPKGLIDYGRVVRNANPLDVLPDGRGRIYVSLWGSSEVAVLDAGTGRILARWAVGLHPNELVLSPDRRRLFVSNGGRNSVTVLDTGDGRATETLSSAFSPSDLPGSTPDSLALSRDGKCLFVANADNNDLAVFDVGDPGRGRALGFIPTGWFPTSVRLTPGQGRLLVVSGQGLTPKPNNLGETTRFTNVGLLYRGSLGVIDLPASGRWERFREALGGSYWREPTFARALGPWTAAAELCHPAPPPPPSGPDDPIPPRGGGPTPIRYVIYIVKENRTYDQVFGDLPEGNGDPHLCLFGEAVTPNLHRLAREFTLFDNFYANAEFSAAGHEWSMGAYASEFVRKVELVTLDSANRTMPYPGEGRYAAAFPALGYLWDRARAAGVTYRDYGEFVSGAGTPASPSTSYVDALRGRVDPLYRGWDLHYSDLDRAARFVSELRRFEAEGEMPRLQILRLPNDHTSFGFPGFRTPRAMVAENDLAVGRIVEAVTHSRFWPRTAVFIVEDDAQNGPDHVDAHRTEALVVSPYVRRHSVDSTPYTTCSMLATIECVLGLSPMSQFDAAAPPMRAAFRPGPDLTPYAAVPARTDLREMNPPGTRAAALSARLDLSREDANDDREANRALWAAVRGDDRTMPAPVHAAFVRSMPSDDGD